jgi:DNA modification methylase
VKRRRSLTHVGGTVATSGEREFAALLAQALDVRPAPEPRSTGPAEGVPSDDPDRAHVHGFHTYPARMHPATAQTLVGALAEPGGTVLDPFCGSGTVLVEARIGGRRATGVDLNPLAVHLARLKIDPRDAASREAIAAAAREIASAADRRRERRAGSTRRYPPEDVALFDPHVLLELDSLRSGIAETAKEDAYLHQALALVLSSVLVKVSRRASDTSAAALPRRIAAGYPARLFARRALDLARRLGDLAALLPAHAPPARVALDDARRLRDVGAATVDAVVTSPPYAGTYDYLSHHALRMRWLDLDPTPLGTGEMGARRRYAALAPRVARDTWEREVTDTLRALARVCRKGARAVILLGDSAIGGEALRADQTLAAAASATGFALLARASQLRPHFHAPTAGAFRRRPRAEHAMMLEKR